MTRRVWAERRNRARSTRDASGCLPYEKLRACAIAIMLAEDHDRNINDTIDNCATCRRTAGDWDEDGRPNGANAPAVASVGDERGVVGRQLELLLRER